LNNIHLFQSLAWSPVGDVVASSLAGEAGPNLALWQLSGRSPIQIGPPGEEPAWAPTGRRLAFRSCDEAGWHLSTIQVVGDQFDPTSQRRLTEGDGRRPAWSWDGQRIAFVQPTDVGGDDIFVIDADGQNLRRLTDDPGPETAPAWTRDNRIIFYAYRDERWGLYTMAADGNDQQLLIETQADPTWQPEPAAVSTDLLAVEPEPPQPTIAMPPGQGLLIVSNRRNPDEMTFTIHQQEHKIGPYQIRNLPLPPGRHTWTASWPGKVSRNGIADIVAGQISYPIVER
jgi:Tol biopolymer transport system component